MLLCPATASAGVLVVDPSGMADFTQIRRAVLQAADGDTILAYETFAVIDKALVIVADAGGSVQVSGAVRVQNLAADRRVVLSGRVVT